MALNDIYVLTLEGGNVGLATRQDFAYKVTGITGGLGAADVREAFVDFMQDPIQNSVSLQMGFQRIVTRNLFDIEDVEEFSFSPDWLGVRTGNTLLTFAAVAFRSQKPAVGQQPARKRFGYLSESDVNGTDIQNVTGYFAALDALATALGTELNTDSSDILSPVVVKRIKYTAPSGKDAYRYPASQGEAVSFPAINWTWDTTVTSQISRKLGRGI